MRESTVPVVVIGAGPYGLSIAAHLRGRGVAFRIFGRPMESWVDSMPKGMLLKSDGFASCLYDPDDYFTLGQYCRDAALPYSPVNDPVPIQRFIDYGLSFRRRYVPDLETQYVLEVRKEGQGFTLLASDGEALFAQTVVVASGISHLAYMPDQLLGLPSELVSHSSAHSDVTKFKGRSVAIVGAGASAVDLAALLYEQGADVQLITRRELVQFHTVTPEPRSLFQRIRAPRSGLGIGWRSRMCCDAPLLFHGLPGSFRHKVVKHHLGPAPGWFMRDRFAERIRVHPESSIRTCRVNGGQITLEVIRRGSGAMTIAVDHLIAATGYKAAVSRLPFLGQTLVSQVRTERETPSLDRNFQSSIPGLYFVGLMSANSFGPLLRFAYGARFTARRVTRHLAARLRGASVRASQIQVISG